MVINFDFRSGAKKSGHLDYPFKSYGPKFVSMHETCGEVGVSEVGGVRLSKKEPDFLSTSHIGASQRMIERGKTG